MISSSIHHPENSEDLECPNGVSSPRQSSVGRRRTLNGLDWSTSICVSSDLHHVQSAGKSSSGKLPSISYSSSMANLILVLSSAGNVSRPSTQSPLVSKVAETDGQTIPPLKPKSPKTSCLKAARRNLQKQGFS